MTLRLNCNECKDRGYVITDIISGSSKECNCRVLKRMEMDVTHTHPHDDLGGRLTLSESPQSPPATIPAIGMIMRITLAGVDVLKAGQSNHHYKKGDLVTVLQLTAVPLSYFFLLNGATYVLRVEETGIPSNIHNIYYPTECEIAF